MTVLTRHDMTNIETGMAVAKRLGRRLGPLHHWPEVPLVLRAFDRALRLWCLAQCFGFVNACSTVESAAPWFICAAIGLQVIDTFFGGQTLAPVRRRHECDVGGSELDGLAYVRPVHDTSGSIADHSTQGEAIELHPRRGHRFLRADDTAYSVGP